jgi:hypothetical protein
MTPRGEEIRRRLLTAAAAVMLPGLALAQVGGGPVNPSVIEWDAPTENACGAPSATCAPLDYVREYSVRCAGPLPLLANPIPPTCEPTVYPIRKTTAAVTAIPTPDTRVRVGTPGARNLSGELGLTQDGQYLLFRHRRGRGRGRESGVQASPGAFSRNLTPLSVGEPRTPGGSDSR